MSSGNAGSNAALSPPDNNANQPGRLRASAKAPPNSRWSRSIVNRQSSIFNIQFSSFNPQSSILNIQYSILNSQFSILNIQFSIPKLSNYKMIGDNSLDHKYFLTPQPNLAILYRFKYYPDSGSNLLFYYSFVWLNIVFAARLVRIFTGSNPAAEFR